MLNFTLEARYCVLRRMADDNDNYQTCYVFHPKRRRWRRRQRTATPSRCSPFFDAAATPRVGGAEDDLSLLLCQPRPTCLHLSLVYEALSHHICEHSRRGHTESAATSIIAGPPSRQEQVRCNPRLRHSSMHLKRSRSGDACKCRAPSPWAKAVPAVIIHCLIHSSFPY